MMGIQQVEEAPSSPMSPTTAANAAAAALAMAEMAANEARDAAAAAEAFEDYMSVAVELNAEGRPVARTLWDFVRLRRSVQRALFRTIDASSPTGFSDYTYEAFYQAVLVLAPRWAAAPLKLRRGQIIGLFGDNTIEYALLVWTAIATGVQPLLLSTKCQMDALLSLVDSAQCGPVFFQYAYLALAQAYKQERPDAQIVLFGLREKEAALASRLKAEGFIIMTDLRPEARIGSLEAPIPPDTPIDTAQGPDRERRNQTVLWFHSSGSTSMPKALPTPLSMAYNNASIMKFMLPADQLASLQICNFLPFFHAYGFSVTFLGTACWGGTFTIPDGHYHNITGERMLEIIEQVGTSMLPSVPFQWQQILAAAEREPDRARRIFKQLKLAMTGAAVMPPEITTRLASLGLPLMNFYGTTETGVVMTSARPGATAFQFTPVARCEMRSRSDIEPGLLEAVVLHDHPGLSSHAHVKRDADNNFPTGDLFKEDPDHPGHYWLQGRADDVIIHINGEKTTAGPLIDFMISQRPDMIKLVAIAGTGHECLAGLVELTPAGLALPRAQVEADVLEPILAAMNAKFPLHSRLFPEMVYILAEDEHLPVTHKGNAVRRLVETQFKRQLDALYRPDLVAGLAVNTSTKAAMRSAATSPMSAAQRGPTTLDMATSPIGLKSPTGPKSPGPKSAAPRSPGPRSPVAKTVMPEAIKSIGLPFWLNGLLCRTLRLEEPRFFLQHATEDVLEERQTTPLDMLGLDSTQAARLRTMLMGALPAFLGDLDPAFFWEFTSFQEIYVELARRLGTPPVDLMQWADRQPLSRSSSTSNTSLEVTAIAVPPLDERNEATAMLEYLHLTEEEIKAFADWVLSQTYVPPVNTTTAADAADTGRHVLLTGATGFVGKHVLERLLRDPQVGHVTCLLRAQDGYATPWHRLVAMLSGAAQTWVWPAIAAGRLNVMHARVEAPLLGLPVGDFLGLATRVTDIVHAGWRLDFNAPLSGFAVSGGGLSGLKNLTLMALAAPALGNRQRDGDAIAFHFVSSISTHLVPLSPQLEQAVVAHRLRRTTVLPPDANTTNTDTTAFGYAASKWISEAALLRLARAHNAAGRRWRVHIHRVGQVTAHTQTGVWNPKEWAPRVLRSALVSGRFPSDLDLPTAWVPVDVLADTLVRSILGPAAAAIQTAVAPSSPTTAVCPVTLYEPDDALPPAALVERMAAGIRAHTEAPVTMVGSTEWLAGLKANSDDPAAELLPFYQSLGQTNADAEAAAAAAAVALQNLNDALARDDVQRAEWPTADGSITGLMDVPFFERVIGFLAQSPKMALGSAASSTEDLSLNDSSDTCVESDVTMSMTSSMKPVLV
ncbi:hypothetical protein CXG81DRAFT_17738 [Caulochytrium protostelioides]|uniref:Acetyl-CoA synthetase-like protein n=1 Tax=Caulochytrium protostelioides TaxID=1555241 RepID=A0A4V1IV27_9FUNG|nr:hypothetical protein CXG81DRAFT_17738 [Caulochytrium protostelioides]|eukprot:RKP02599.1 hypothetical protein CXG81DRAFT_17738 [Caulochytrium protostelioides]